MAYHQDGQRIHGPYYNLKHDPQPFSLDLHQQQQQQQQQEAAAASVFGAAPPPPPPLSVQTNPSPRPTNTFRSCLAISCYIIILVLAFVGFSMLILYLVYHPKVPTFSVRTFRVSQLNLTSDSSANLTFVKYHILATLAVVNPNKRLRLAYGSFKVEVVYQDEQLAMMSLPPFEQGKKNTSILKVEMESPGSSLSKEKGNSLQADLDKDRIFFFVGIGVEARLLLGYSRSLPFWVYSGCNIEVTSPSSSGGSRILKNECGIPR